MPNKDSAKLRDELFAGKSLKTNLRDIVSRAATGYKYFELCEIVADPDNEDGLDQSEVDEIDKTVILLAHLFGAHTAAQVDAAEHNIETVQAWNKRALESDNSDVWFRCHQMIAAHLTIGQKEQS